MTDLNDETLHELAGGDVRTLGDAEAVEPVTAADVEAARQAAEKAEQTAAESERKAVLGQMSDGQAVSARQAATFARLRVALAQRKAERHQAAERIRSLAAVGEEALKHAAALKDLKTATAADLQTISERQQAIRDRAAAWSDELAGLIARGAALEPEKPRPGMVPAPSSAHVYAGGAGVTNAVFVVRNKVLHPIREDHPDGPVAAIDAALEVTRQHDPTTRLVRGENGLVTPMGTDPGGHLQRRINEGTIHELSLPEREAYWRGEH